MSKTIRNPLLVSALIFLLLGVNGCIKKIDTKSFNYGTKNDSARFYFEKGWQEIMDHGRWTESEIAFKKASKLDPNWALGKSMVARITQNLKERQQLLKELQKTKYQVKGDDRPLLNVNLLSIIAANNRDLGIKNTKEFNQNRWKIAENNFGIFARKHPNDNYFKAEYIEVLHLNHGAQTALDSLNILTNDKQKELGFFIAYEAELQLELGNLKKAAELLKRLESQHTNLSYNSTLVLKARILKHQDSLQKAKTIIDRVIQKDTNHLIAKGLQMQLENLLKKND